MEPWLLDGIIEMLHVDVLISSYLLLKMYTCLAPRGLDVWAPCWLAPAPQVVLKPLHYGCLLKVSGARRAD